MASPTLQETRCIMASLTLQETRSIMAALTLQETRSIMASLTLQETRSTHVSPLANELDVRSELQGQVSLAAVNQFYVIHEAMDGCRNLKMHQRLALEM